jgi:hypothetical protein
MLRRAAQAVLRRAARPACAALLLALLSAPAAQASLPARALLASCTKGAGETARAAVFEGRMTRLRHTVRMQMRFTVQVRTPERPRWAAVSARGLDRWRTSASGVTRYVFDERVVGLYAPAAYRAVVRFRWLGAHGVVLARAVATTPPCRQPDPRPNLVVRQVLVRDALAAGMRRYVAVVANAGRTAANPFSVAFSSDGAPIGRASAAALAPGATVRVHVVAPACAAGATVRAEADADDAVDERDERDNSLAIACPATATAGAWAPQAPSTLG